MTFMFANATSFDGDISRWTVSGVEDISCMFLDAASFSGDISDWDVSSVTNMNEMFRGAGSFNQELCGVAWVHSKTTKNQIFQGSSGSISRAVCPASSPQRWLGRWAIATTQTKICPSCGRFRKSGRVSCCAPSGTWYKHCGHADSRKFSYSWLEGVQACIRTSSVDSCRHVCMSY